MGAPLGHDFQRSDDDIEERARLGIEGAAPHDVVGPTRWNRAASPAEDRQHEVVVEERLSGQRF